MSGSVRSVSPGLNTLPSQSSVRLELRCAFRREATERTGPPSSHTVTYETSPE